MSALLRRPRTESNWLDLDFTRRAVRGGVRQILPSIRTVTEGNHGDKLRRECLSRTGEPRAGTAHCDDLVAFRDLATDPRDARDARRVGRFGSCRDGEDFVTLAGDEVVVWFDGAGGSPYRAETNAPSRILWRAESRRGTVDFFGICARMRWHALRSASGMAKRRAENAPLGITSNGLVVVNALALLAPEVAERLRRALPKNGDWFVAASIADSELPALLSRFDDAAAEAVARLVAARRAPKSRTRRKPGKPPVR